jgi:hypothetical protein
VVQEMQQDKQVLPLLILDLAAEALVVMKLIYLEVMEVQELLLLVTQAHNKQWVELLQHQVEIQFTHSMPAVIFKR